MKHKLLNIGFGSTVIANRVVAIVQPNSAPMKRLRNEAKDNMRLVDATHGRKTRAMIIMDSNHVVLSAIQAETISLRYTMLRNVDEITSATMHHSIRPSLPDLQSQKS